MDRRVVALVVERIALPQRAEAPPEIIDERPRQEGLLPAGAYPLPPVHIVVYKRPVLPVREVRLLFLPSARCSGRLNGSACPAPAMDISVVAFCVLACVFQKWVAT